jgi:DNA adenine methylase
MTLAALRFLPSSYERLRRVLWLNRPALEVIRGHDGPKTLFYLDPPYYHPTRTAKKVYGAFEMTDDEHVQLLNVLLRVKGKVMLSGYANDLDDTTLARWTRHTFDVPNHASGSRTKRKMTEVLWCNF